MALWSNNDYIIRPAKNTDEFREVWWGFMQVLGWNRGYYDIDTYMNHSLGSGMFLLMERSSGKPVGHVAAVINANSTGWVSMFIIDDKHRGKGLGRELFRAAEADFVRHGTRFMGLDGVVEQKATYERRGFQSSPLGTIRIMIRPLVAREPVHEPASTLSIVDIRKIPRHLLTEHECQYTGFDRPGLWSDEHLFNRRDVEGVAVLANENPQTVNDIVAWAITRRCSGGIRIGPVYASDAEPGRAALIAAMKLATPELIKQVDLPHEAMNEWPLEKIASDATLVAEVWGGNASAVKLFDDLGWKPAGVEYYRMWVDGKAPAEQSRGGLSQQGVYAIFDAAIG